MEPLILYKVIFIRNKIKDLAFTHAINYKDAVENIRKRYKRDKIVISSITIFKGHF